MGRTPSEIILRQLLKTNCSTYEELKKLIEQYGYKAAGIYEYVKGLKRKGYVAVLKMSKKRIVCINDSIRRELTLILKAYSE